MDQIHQHKTLLLLLIPNYKTWYTFSMPLLSSAYMTWRHVSKTHMPHTHHQISHVCTKRIQNFEIDNIYTWWFGKVSNRYCLSCNVYKYSKQFTDLIPQTDPVFFSFPSRMPYFTSRSFQEQFQNTNKNQTIITYIRLKNTLDTTIQLSE